MWEGGGAVGLLCWLDEAEALSAGCWLCSCARTWRVRVSMSAVPVAPARAICEEDRDNTQS